MEEQARKRAVPPTGGPPVGGGEKSATKPHEILPLPAGGEMLPPAPGEDQVSPQWENKGRPTARVCLFPNFFLGQEKHPRGGPFRTLGPRKNPAWTIA